MKTKKILAVLSALTMTFTTMAGYLPVSAFRHSVKNVYAEDQDMPSLDIELPDVVFKAAENGVTEDGWEYSVSGEAVTITGYSGELTELVVPEKINGVSVTTIRREAFAGNTAITSIDLGSVQKLEYCVFKGCTSLKEVTIPKTVKSAGSLSYGCFEDSSVETVIFEEGIENIPEFVCHNSKSVKKIVLPEKEDNIDGYRIGRFAFKNSGITEVTLPKSLTRIDQSAFQYCENLTEIVIPEGVNTIEREAFANCKSLASIDLGCVQTIGSEILRDTPLIKEITIPATVKTAASLQTGALNQSAVETVIFAEGIENIPDYTCQGASALKNIIIPEKEDLIDGYRIGAGAFKDTNITEFPDLKNVTKIGDNAFENCVYLTEVTIPEGVNTIGNYVFAGCKRLKSIDLGSVETLGGGIFGAALSLKEITIPKSVKKSGMSYRGCLDGSSIETVTFEDGIENIPAFICYGGANVENVIMPEKEDLTDGYTIGEAAFKGTNLKTVAIPESVTVIGTDAFADCAYLTEVKLPDNVSKLGNYVFAGCKRLASIDLNKVTELGGGVFQDSVSLKELTIPVSVKIAGVSYKGCLNGSYVETITFADGCKTVPAYICMGADKLTKLEMPEGIVTIGESAFDGCSSLTEVNIPESVKNINNYAFCLCTQLTSIDLKNVEKIGVGFLGGSVRIKELTIPKTIKETGTSWKSALDGSRVEKLIFEDGCKIVPSYISGANPYLVSVEIPDTVETIGKNAFEGCNNLEAIDVPMSVKSIGDCAFRDCPLLRSISFGNAETIGYQVIDKNYLIKEVILPANINKTGTSWQSCFNDCGVERIILADGAVSLPSYLAGGCNTLKMVVLPDTCVEIKDRAFENCPEFDTVISKVDEFKFYSNSFKECPKLHDQRFSLLNYENTYIAVNSSQNSVDGLVNFTLKYEFLPKYASRVSSIDLNLDLPKGITLMLDTIYSRDVEIDVESFKNQSLSLNSPKGEIYFSGRIIEPGDHVADANISFRYNGGSWKQYIGSTIVESPDLTLSAPNTVNELKADIYGIAPKGEEVKIYVNDALEATLVSSIYTGKYKGTIILPDGAENNTYVIHAECGEYKCSDATVVYSEETPIIKKVNFTFNDHQDSSIDITNVLEKGTSPVVSINPYYPVGFYIEATHNEKIDRMFVTSTKGDSEKYMEAYYNSETGLWEAVGYFEPSNKSYVPGKLNISIIEKQEINLDDYDPNEPDVLEGISDDIIENSSVTIIEDESDHFIASIEVADGENTEKGEVFVSDEQEGIYCGDTFVTVEEISQDPQKYGYIPLSTPIYENGVKTSYYVKTPDSKEIEETLLRSLGSEYKNAKDFINGTSILKLVEDEFAPGFSGTMTGKLANTFITSGVSKMSKVLCDNDYGNLCKMLGFASDTCTYLADIVAADGNSEYETAATVLFALKALNTFGATDALLTMIGIPYPASLVAKFFVGQALNKAEDYLQDCIRNNRHFTLSGFIRFIIDPSGIVYEAVITNPITGATVTIYYKDPETGEEILWNAEDYDQLNPLITGSDGAYLWDVPEGLWKIVCEKEGYDTEETDWMTVPPVRTDVNFNLKDHVVPELDFAEYYDGSVFVGFTKYMDIETITTDTIKVEGAEIESVTPCLETPGDTAAVKFEIKGDFSNAEYVKVFSSEDCKSYSGISAKVDSVAANIPHEEDPITTTTTSGNSEPITTTTTAAVPVETTTEAPAPVETTTEAPAPVETTTEAPAPVETTTEAPTPVETTTEAPAPVETTTATTETEPPVTTEPVEPTEIPLGDVNRDGTVDSFDASLVLIEYAKKQTGGESTLDDEQFIAADANCDETVDASDASLILIFYSYIQTGGPIKDMRTWLKERD